MLFLTFHIFPAQLDMICQNTNACPSSQLLEDELSLPSNFYVEVLTSCTSDVTLFRDRAFSEVIKVK